MMKNTTVIPVRFRGGTGGNFLNAWLRAAKLHNDPAQVSWQFSPRGNAHASSQDGRQGDLWDDREEMLSTLYSIKWMLQPSTAPYYISTHIPEQDLLQARFARTVNITFTPTRDARELAAMLYGKWWEELGLPESQRNPDNPRPWTVKFRAMEPHDVLVGMFKEFLLVPGLTVPWAEKESTADHLYISWWELLHGDPDQLTYKLEQWCGYSSNQFSLEPLRTWRTLTLQCIEDVYRLDPQADYYTTALVQMMKSRKGQEFSQILKSEAT